MPLLCGALGGSRLVDFIRRLESPRRKLSHKFSVRKIKKKKNSRQEAGCAGGALLNLFLDSLLEAPAKASRLEFSLASVVLYM